MNHHINAYYHPEKGLYHRHFSAMGTRLDMVITGVGESSGQSAGEEIRKMVAALESLMNRFDEESPVYTLNHFAGRRPMRLGPELFGILQRCVDYYDRSGHLFEVCRGGMDALEMDPASRMAFITDKNVFLDFGGIGKGIALDRANDLLKSLEIPDAFISFGDSSITARGNHPHGKGWIAGINHKLRPGESLYTFELKNESVSTSGSDRYQYHPDVGATNFRQVSVCTKSATDAEVLSTALMIGNGRETEILARFAPCRAVSIEYQGEGEPRIRNLAEQ